MATPLDILTQAHAAQQGREGLQAALQARRAFTGIDFDSKIQVARTVDAVVPTLLQRRAASVASSRSYYARARAVSQGRTTLMPSVPDDATAEERLRSSLWILARGRREREDRGKTQGEIARSAVRHTLDGGRSYISTTVLRDETALGFTRHTAGDARVCAFCAMLASREDYKATSFARSDPRFEMGGNPLANAKVHDGCRCTLRPVFIGDPVPPQTRIALDLWKSLSEGDGKDAWRSFRRNYNRAVAAGTPIWQTA